MLRISHHHATAATRWGKTKRRTTPLIQGKKYNLFMALFFWSRTGYDYNNLVMDLNRFQMMNLLKNWTFVFNKSSSEPLRPLAKGDLPVYLNHRRSSFGWRIIWPPFRILMFPNSLIFFQNHFWILWIREMITELILLVVFNGLKSWKRVDSGEWQLLLLISSDMRWATQCCWCGWNYAS